MRTPDRYPDAGAIYESVRKGFVDLLTSQPRVVDLRPVPATPAWTVHDVFAHVVGIAADLNAARFPDPDDAGGEAFAAAQVASRRHRSFDDLVAEWGSEAPAFEDGLRMFGYEVGSHFVGDLVTHLHDVREALGLPPDPDPAAVGVALDHYLGFVGERLTQLGGAVRVVTEERDVVLGTGAEVAALRAAAFEVLRCLSARRSLRHLRSLQWDGDGDTAVALLARVYEAGYAFPDD